MRSRLEVLQEEFVFPSAGNLNLSATNIQKQRDFVYLAGGRSNHSTALDWISSQDLRKQTVQVERMTVVRPFYGACSDYFFVASALETRGRGRF